MADDIQVRFGGDAAGIRAAADQAKGTIQGFATTARSQNATARQSYDELKAAIDAANAALRQIQASAENTSTLATQARAVAVLVTAYEGLRAANEAVSGATGRTYAAVEPPSRPPRPRPGPAPPHWWSSPSTRSRPRAPSTSRPCPPKG